MSTNGTTHPGHEIEQAFGLYGGWITELSARRERSESLWQMSAEERVEAMYRGELSFAALCAWAAARPHEVPLLDGEFWFIAIQSSDVADGPSSADRLRERSLSAKESRDADR